MKRRFKLASVAGAFLMLGTLIPAASATTADSGPPVNRDADAKEDLGTLNFAGDAFVWFFVHSTNGSAEAPEWGFTNDQDPILGDFKGDGQNDLTALDFNTSQWWIKYSSNGIVQTPVFEPDSFSPNVLVDNGSPIHFSHDFTGDGKSDLALTGTNDDTGNLFWGVRASEDGALIGDDFGLPDDARVPGDYFGIGSALPAVIRPMDDDNNINTPDVLHWLLMTPTGGFVDVPWGLNTDTIPMPADYDGDGATDPAVVTCNPDTFNLEWWIAGSAGTDYAVPWGSCENSFLQSTNFADFPTATDNNGDGKADIGVFRISESGPTQFIIRSSANGSMSIRPWESQFIESIPFSILQLIDTEGGFLAKPMVANIDRVKKLQQQMHHW